jgi:FAD-dependent urate hydroxylase
MPVGMLLRSNWTATQIADPGDCLTLERYQAACENRVSLPVPLDRFIQYGTWYQQRAVPNLDRRSVTLVERDSDRFRVRLEDDQALMARRVVIATGIGSFVWIPPPFRDLPPSVASHTSSHRDFGNFARKRVIVIGGGQSALESAALLHESGAEVEVLARTHHIHWLQGATSRLLHHRLGKSVNRVLYAPTDVGPAGISQLMARPDLVRSLPRAVQDRLRKRAVRPAGARWLVSRLSNVPIRLGRSVVSAAVTGDRIRLRLDDQSEEVADHALLGTGYRVDISLHKFISPKLRAAIDSVGGFPVLGRGLETSVPGLHILGAPAARSFGPLMQFVSGTKYTSRALLRCIDGRS